MVFLGNQGITSTEANHIANIAQEEIKSTVELLNNVRFYNVKAQLISSHELIPFSEGVMSVDFIMPGLEKVAKMNSLCAWLREAIKEKERLLNANDVKSIERWCEEQNKEFPIAPIRPKDIEYVTEEEIINSWDAEKRNKYLCLEAQASTFGKYIHPDGAYNKARKELYKVISNPTYKEGTGRDTVLYHQEVTIPANLVDDLFMQLQSSYRSYEKELNLMKAELKSSVNQENIRKTNLYSSEYRKYEEDYAKYKSSRDLLYNEFQKWKTQEREKISKLRIVIPESLKEIFNEVQKLTI